MLGDLVLDGDLLRFRLGEGDLLRSGEADLESLPVGLRRCSGGDLD